MPSPSVPSPFAPIPFAPIRERPFHERRFHERRFHERGSMSADSSAESIGAGSLGADPTPDVGAREVGAPRAADARAPTGCSRSINARGPCYATAADGRHRLARDAGRRRLSVRQPRDHGHRLRRRTGAAAVEPVAPHPGAATRSALQPASRPARPWRPAGPSAAIGDRERRPGRPWSSRPSLVARRFLARHPMAARYADFADFDFYRLEIVGPGSTAASPTPSRCNRRT